MAKWDHIEDQLKSAPKEPTRDRQADALERIAAASFEALAEKHAQRRAEVLHVLTKHNPAYEEARDA